MVSEDIKVIIWKELRSDLANTRHGDRSKVNEGRILCLFALCSPGQKVEDL